VRIRKIGFAPATLLVTISPDDTVPLTVLLKSAPQLLPTVFTKDSTTRKYVSPGLQAFEERRRAGSGGYFIAEAELRKNDSKRMTNVVRTIPGVNITCINRGLRIGDCYASSHRQGSARAFGGGDCPVDVYLNGIVYTDNDLQKLAVDQFAGIEFYAGGASIPIQYNKTGSSCGVLLLWTRER
jgi:hypothetical protein